MSIHRLCVCPCDWSPDTLSLVGRHHVDTGEWVRSEHLLGFLIASGPTLNHTPWVLSGLREPLGPTVLVVWSVTEYPSVCLPLWGSRPIPRSSGDRHPICRGS